ncbi:MAG: TonB-dependent receptor [Gemmatimonadales bacterium]
MAARRFRGLLLAVCLGLTPLCSLTAQRPDTLPPVEVVATRMPEAPHDVPASVEVISGQDLRARGARNLREALALATGVSIAPGGDGGPAAAVPELLGLRELDAFLLVVDGIPWGGALNPALATLDLNDVERIEILRGPAPVTYGATSFVGVIQVVHRSAGAPSQTVSISGGSFGSVAASTELSLPAGRWSHRVGVDLDRDAFRDDRAEAARGHGLWRSAVTSGDRTTWFMGDVTVLRQNPASPHPRQGPALTTLVPIDANHNPAGAYLNEDRFVVSAGHQRSVGRAVWGSQVAFTHSSQRMLRGFLVDLSDAPDNAAGFREEIDVNDLYADTHVIVSPDARVRVLAGGDLLFANGEARGATFRYSAPLDGETGGMVAPPTVLDRDAEDRRLFLGAYGSLEWRPVERLTLSAGLRLNSTSERRGEGESVTHDRLSGSVGALIGLWEQGAEHARLFAGYRSTFKPAAFDFGLAENEGVLDPETSNTYEAGLKTRFAEGRVDVTASVFRMDFSNLVVSTIVDDLPALLNAGETRFQGFELATDLRLRPSLFLRGSYSFHDGKFVDFAQSFDGDPPVQLGGNRFEMSARHLASAGLTLAPVVGVIAHASVGYTGDRYLNKRNTALAEGFWTFDAGIGYRLDRVEFRLDGRNLGDRRDPVSESEFGDAQYYRMTPRSVRVGIALRY